MYAKMLKLFDLRKFLEEKQREMAKKLAHEKLCNEIKLGKRVSAELLAAETDPKRKRELVEAIGLSKVR